MSVFDKIVRMCDVIYDKKLFENFRVGNALDNILCNYLGLPKGVNYMIIGDPGVGKTTIILDMLANIQTLFPDAKILFLSVEMNEIDLAVYMQRYPKFRFINMLFIESEMEGGSHIWPELTEALYFGWDIVAIDSFSELQGIIKEEEGIRQKKAESMILALIKKHNKGCNKRRVNTTFLTIQQVTKMGNFIGSNRLKHSITAMMELRLENAKDIYSDRYIVFSKHRRGDVGVRLYFSLSTEGDVYYDEERFKQDTKIKHMLANVSTQLRNFADKFENLFNNNINN
jgi:predicted ATP-dependent serine protease